MRFVDLPRCSGVLLPLTSLPGGQGSGDAGPAARSFINWLADQGAKVWQTLPLTIPGRGHSPYSSPSAFALSPGLISLEDLVTDGLLDRSALKDAPVNDARVDYQAQSDFRTPLLSEVADRLIANSPDLIDQHSHQHPELLKAAWFTYFAGRERSADWARWNDAELRDDPPQGVQRFLAIQLLAHRQWQSLRAHARKRGIVLLGDMPIGVDRESADVWQYPNLFALREDGGTAWQAGVPPDAFSDDGQCWQMPCFSWDDHASSAFSWWRQRVQSALDSFDLVRIDHFRGLDRYFAIPGDELTARNGSWRAAPGRDLLTCLKSDHPNLPLIAEDLGLIDEPVRTLRDDFELPGMHVLQFLDLDRTDCPHRMSGHKEHGIAYLGTHDNEPSSTWWERLSPAVRKRMTSELGIEDSAGQLSQALNRSTCRLAVHTVQDLMGLDASSRLNQPGVPKGQWTWRFEGSWPDRQLPLRRA